MTCGAAPKSSKTADEHLNVWLRLSDEYKRVFLDAPGYLTTNCLLFQVTTDNKGRRRRPRRPSPVEASCRYVATLLPPHVFQEGMDAYWGALNFTTGGTLLGWPWVGTGRYAMEHWVHSHPSVRPCDVSPKPLEFLSDMIQLSSGGFDSSVATAAPRVDTVFESASCIPSRRFASRRLGGASDAVDVPSPVDVRAGIEGEAMSIKCGITRAQHNEGGACRDFDTILGEWRTLYETVPPETSLVLQKYRLMYERPEPLDGT